MTSSSSASEAGVTLLDLRQQMPFDIDDQLRLELCFSETLIVSCAHYEGDDPGDFDRDFHPEERRGSEGELGVGAESSGWTCSSTKTASTVTKSPEPFEIKDFVPEPEPEEEPEEETDFHFYFFPDCKVPQPVGQQYSNQSLIYGDDGIPKLNPAAKLGDVCTCDIDKKKNTCECFTVLPCNCGAKKKEECTCRKLREICICNESKPATICTCGKDPKVCTCFPGLPQPVCVCDQVAKPCICNEREGRYPRPVCDCKYKPKWRPPPGLAIDEKWEEAEAEPEFESGEEEGEGNEELVEEEEQSKKNVNRLNSTLMDVNEYKKFEKVVEEEPCNCQIPEPKLHCLCLKGKECTCLKDACICGVQKTCVCEPTDDSEPICKSASADSKIICECKNPQECTCDAKESNCKCFPKKAFCTCGDDPENCKCKEIKDCECAGVCICDTKEKKSLECVCLDLAKQLGRGVVCTCERKPGGNEKLKKLRAGKQGYRWCHDVDPYHTYFDYAYGRHDLIDYKEQEKEKFKILGLYDEKVDEVCAVHGLKMPPFKKKVRKPSMDCCSSVGGITISVETLGDDQDKFLVQINSHASKEGANTGSKLVSIIDANLHTLEENRTEYISKRNLSKERKSYMAICANGYYNKVTRICGDKHVGKRLYHTFDHAKDFLLEGANVVLLRYFGLRRYKGSIKTTTVLMDGTICESVYVCPGVSQAIVNGKPLFVVKVERHIIHPNGEIYQTLTVLSLRGYIISHEWDNNNYVLHINPLLKVIPEKDLIQEHAPIRDKWREDLQLLSDYLDFKSAQKQAGQRYVSENGQLTSTVKDYLQAILLLKPRDVIHFTRHYFNSTLSSMDLPRNKYFDPDAKRVRYFYTEDD